MVGLMSALVFAGVALTVFLVLLSGLQWAARKHLDDVERGEWL